MRLCIITSIYLFVILIYPVHSFAKGFQKYSNEVSYIKLMHDCAIEKVLPAMKGFGSLYICTLGDAKTVKLFVSEKPNSGEMLNVGIIWNDWKTNIGYRMHSDLKEVEKALNFLIDMYVPSRKNEIKRAFWDSKNEDFSTSDFMIYFTQKTGLQKDERLIVIEER